VCKLSRTGFNFVCSFSSLYGICRNHFRNYRHVDGLILYFNYIYLYECTMYECMYFWSNVSFYFNFIINSQKDGASVHVNCRFQFIFLQRFFLQTLWVSLDFLEHIFKKMGSTEIVVSSVRPSVLPSVRPSVRPSVLPSVCLSVSYFSAAIAPRELKFQHKSVALLWSIVRSGIWGPWPRSPGFWPWPGPLPKKIWCAGRARVNFPHIAN
jgi:hypothetical protein